MIVKATRTLFLWCLLPAGLLALAFVIKSGILAVCVYCCFLVVGMARVATHFWMRPLQVKRTISVDSVRVGQPVSVFIEIHNPGFLPVLWTYVEETLPERMLVQGQTKRLLSLPPRSRFILYYTVTPTQRGCHRLGPLVMETGDPFGLFRRFRVDDRVGFFTALPAYEVIEEYEAGQNRKLGDYAAERSLFEDPTRLKSVREYRRGDSMRRIHWRASAHAGELYTKVYEAVREPAATVVLDFHQATWAEAIAPPDAPPVEERAVELACSICRYLTDGRWKTGFFSNGRDPLGIPGLMMAQARSVDSLPDAQLFALNKKKDTRLEPIRIESRSHSEQFSIIHENMGRLKLSDGLGIGELLQGELARIARHEVIVLITAAMDEILVDVILRARRHGYRIMIFFLANRAAHDLAFETLVPYGVEVFDLTESWRLEEVATGRWSI